MEFMPFRLSVPGATGVAGPGFQPHLCAVVIREAVGGTALVTCRPQPAKKQGTWMGDALGANTRSKH